ncbi:lipocalin-like domain-containing protein [Vibrio sp. TBV020]|uniref:lipocalin-like domain-containing protein n=1 Tax=Vibrio sp. TBV020 TaxID=3137398 RepID=UPI0038CDA96A
MAVKIKRKTKLVLIMLVVIATVIALYLNGTPRQADVAQSDELSRAFRAPIDQVFEPVLPDNPVVLPEDFGFHNRFQHGWWHFFANVRDNQGKEYGIQWSYFRIASNDSGMSGWLSPQLFISHIVITSKDQVWREQRVARGGIGQAGMTVKPFKLWIDNWYWRSLGKTPFPGLLDVATDTFSIRLKTLTKGPFVIPGDQGYVPKHDLLPIASHNITSPFLEVRGDLSLGNGKVISISGQGWMSKEWGSGLLADNQEGWDWFVVHLDNDTTMSVTRSRHDKQMSYSFGTLSSNDGKAVRLDDSEIEITPLRETLLLNGKRVPLQWSIKIPKHGIDLTTQSLNGDIWLPFIVPYGEAPIKTTGTHQAVGFMQLTGY